MHEHECLCIFCADHAYISTGVVITMHMQVCMLDRFCEHQRTHFAYTLATGCAYALVPQNLYSVCLFVCLSFEIKPKSPYFSSHPGLEVNLEVNQNYTRRFTCAYTQKDKTKLNKAKGHRNKTKQSTRTQDCGSNSDLLIRPSNSDVSALREISWKKIRVENPF